MKKYILILLLFISSLAQAQFGWSGLSANQWVSALDAKGSSFYQKVLLPSSVQLMTKTDALYYLDINPFYLNGLADNQFITPIDLVAAYSSNVIDWNLSIPYAMSDAYMSITKNGTEVVHVTGAEPYQYGSFTVADGDEILVVIQTANSDPNGEEALISAIGENGVNYSSIYTGFGWFTTINFTWHTSNHNTTINGIIRAVVAVNTYYSQEAWANVKKNNCSSGQTGSVVTYNVPYSAYTSIISQEDADAQAQSDIRANAQNYANANGTCSGTPPSTHTVYWNFLTWYATGSYNIYKNGTLLLNGSTNGAHGTFTVADGDVLIITVPKYGSRVHFYRGIEIHTATGVRYESQSDWYYYPVDATLNIIVLSTDGDITIPMAVRYYGT